MDSVFYPGSTVSAGQFSLAASSTLGDGSNTSYNAAVVGRVQNMSSGIVSEAQTFKSLSCLNSGTGSLINCYGYYADNQVGGTNSNIGFYSNVSPGTKKFDFFANGGATNYFNGNLGIGTTNPSTKFEVSGAGPQIRISNISGPATTEIVANAASKGSISFSSAAAPSTIRGAVQYDNPTDSLRFATNLTYDRMILDSNGNVGIGTTTPSAPLHVSNSTYEALRLERTSNPGAVAQTFKIADGSMTEIKNLAGSIYFSPSDGVTGVTVSPAMVVARTSGNVGIGTSSPSYTLDVNGGTNAIRFQQGGGTRVMMIDGSGMSFNTTGVYGSNSWSYVGQLEVNNQLATRHGIVVKGYTSQSGDAFRYVNSSSSLLASITATGGAYFGDNVGIGSTNPGYKLDVVGDISASGCLRSSAGIASGTCVSDERLKTDIRPFDLGLEALLGINPRFLKYNGLGGHPVSDRPELGVIAQEVERTAPQLVETKKAKLNHEDDHTTEIKQVNYTAFTYVLINAVKDLYHRWIDDSQMLHREIVSMKDENIRLRVDVLKQKQENAAIKTYLCMKDPQAFVCK